MADTFLLQLVSPERMLVEEQVTEAQIPALDGYIGVLPGAAPLVSALKPGGVLSYRANGAENYIAVYGGFVEVLPDRVRVLADGAEQRSEIKIEDARQKLEAANKGLLSGGGNSEGADPAVALDEAMRAQARFDTAQAQR